MSIHVESFENKTLWNNFIWKNTTDTFHQSWEWGEMHKTLGNKVWRLAVIEHKQILAACLAIKIHAKRGTFILIPHGPIFSSKSYGKELKILTDELVKIGKEHSCSFMRIAPIVERSEENQKIFSIYGFKKAPIFVQSELSLVLNITPDEKTLLKGMRKTTRQILKKADEFKVSYSCSSTEKDFDVFYDLYSLTVKNQGYSGHKKSFIQNEFRAFQESNCAFLYFVEYKNKPIAGAFIIIQNKTGYYHYGASLRTNENIPAPHLLQWHIIRDLKKRGCTQYNFWGIAPSDKPSHPWYGLTLFKKGFGGEEKAFLETQDYILNSKYLLNWVIEKVRKIKRRY